MRTETEIKKQGDLYAGIPYSCSSSNLISFLGDSSPEFYASPKHLQCSSSYPQAKPKFKQHGPDSIHSWLTAAACALSTLFALAPLRSSGFLYVTIMNEFNVSRQEASWTIMILGGARFLSGLLAGFLGDAFTTRPLIIFGSIVSALGVALCVFVKSIWVLHLTLGLIHGFGSGIVYSMNPIVISEHFIKHKAFAMGINYAGSTLGTFVFPKLLEYVVGLYGFRYAMLIFGGILFNSVAFSLFLRQPFWLNKRATVSNTSEICELGFQGPTEPFIISGSITGQVTSHNDKPNLIYRGLNIARLPMFYVVTFSFISFGLGYDCYNSLLVDFAIDKGIAKSKAVGMTSLCSVADLAGRLILPALTDRNLVKRSTLMILLLSLVGVLYIMLPYASECGYIFTLTLGLAALLGCGVVLFPVLLGEYVGLESIAMATGLMTSLSAVFSFTKPSIIGYFRDTLGAYNLLFVACGCVTILASSTWVVAEYARQKTVKNKWTIDQTQTTTNILVGTYSLIP
ncbi:monocarboxylate transporter 12 isoform X1 [Ixodes scapularis]